MAQSKSLTKAMFDATKKLKNFDRNIPLFSSSILSLHIVIFFGYHIPPMSSNASSLVTDLGFG